MLNILNIDMDQAKGPNTLMPIFQHPAFAQRLHAWLDQIKNCVSVCLLFPPSICAPLPLSLLNIGRNACLIQG